MSDTGINKATFQDLEGSGGTFEVQYNPKEFKFGKTASWKEHEKQGEGKPPLEYQKNAPATLSLELFFDTTAEMADGAEPTDVRDAWVNGLLQLTNPTVTQSSGPEKQRPPKVLFSWGTFSMEAVLEKVDVTYLMFSAGGTPVRARASVSLKEWGSATYEGGASSTSYEYPDAKLTVAGAGTTAYDLATAAGISTQVFCDLNGILDPLADLVAGQEYIVAQLDSALSTAASVYQSASNIISAAESVVNNPSSAGSAASTISEDVEDIGDALGSFF